MIVGSAELRKREDENKREETGERRAAKPTCSGIPAPGIPSDCSDLTDYINTLKEGRSCHSERWRTASTRVK